MERIYLDHAATTPLRGEVRDAMMAVYADGPGNPSSIHAYGRAARARLEEARERLAAVLGARRREIAFTSGGTETDNLAILGRWRASVQSGLPGGVVCSAIEHKAVLAAARRAGTEGAPLVVLAVDEEGCVDPSSVAEAVASRPAVVSVMWANNEVGTIQPVARIADICREADVVFHTDAVQAFGRERVRVDEIDCGLLTVSAHKIGGPAGIGALFVRSTIDLVPLFEGGGQESGIRSGTENLAGAVGLAVAAELAEREREAEAHRLAGLRARLESGLRNRIPGLVVNAGNAERVPHILNVTIPGLDAAPLIMALDMEGLAVSSGSACQSGTVEPSHVLAAMGRDSGHGASVRFSLGRTTTGTEIDRAIDLVVRVADRVRALHGT